jgi:hypothetical protein
MAEVSLLQDAGKLERKETFIELRAKGYSQANKERADDSDDRFDDSWIHCFAVLGNHHGALQSLGHPWLGKVDENLGGPHAIGHALFSFGVAL